MKRIFILLLFFTQVARTQPHIKGTVSLSLTTGLMACDFTLTNLPPLAQYRILLNHGMNIEYVITDSGKVLAYDGFYSGKMRGEALEYALLKNDEDTFASLPPSFRIRYRGAFPVYGDTLNSFDFKGFIAFNGKTARAAEQSKWYPVLYDVVNDRLIENYTYDITVNSDAKTTFINGSVPQQIPEARFQSAIPRALFLFAGNYNYVAAHGNYILNADIDSLTAKKIFTELDRIKAFQAKALGLTFNENVYLISHKAVEPFERERSWGFTIFPSFAYAGLNFKTLLDSTNHMNKGNLTFFAHELGHYYFGDKVQSGLLRWFWLESTAEFMSLKTAEALTDTAFYNGRIRNYTSYLKKKNYPPLAKITDAETIDGDYRYVYGPLVWVSFEKTFGQKNTFAVLANLIARAEKETLTLAILKQAVLKAGIKEAAYMAFETNYLSSDSALQNTLKLLSTAQK